MNHSVYSAHGFQRLAPWSVHRHHSKSLLEYHKLCSSWYSSWQASCAPNFCGCKTLGFRQYNRHFPTWQLKGTAQKPTVCSSQGSLVQLWNRAAQFVLPATVTTGLTDDIVEAQPFWNLIILMNHPWPWYCCTSVWEGSNAGMQGQSVSQTLLSRRCLCGHSTYSKTCMLERIAACRKIYYWSKWKRRNYSRCNRYQKCCVRKLWDQLLNIYNCYIHTC